MPPDCRTFNADLRIKGASSGLYTYADCSVVCGELQYSCDQKDVILNRGKKFELYRTIESFRDYLIVHQNRMLSITPNKTTAIGCSGNTQE